MQQAKKVLAPFSSAKTMVSIVGGTGSAMTKDLIHQQCVGAWLSRA